MPRRAALGVLLTVVAIAVPGTALADPGGDKAGVDAQLAQTQATLEAATARAQQAAVDYQQATAALPGAQTALAQAQGDLVGAQAAQRSADRRAAAAVAQARAADNGYAAAATQVEQARAQVGAFVSNAYKGSGFLALDSILESASPNELAVRIGYLDQVAASQRHALNEVTVARQVARQRQGDPDQARHAAEQAPQAARDAVADALAPPMGAQQAADGVPALGIQEPQALACAQSQ